MNKPSHTPGPWFWVLNEEYKQVQLRNYKHDIILRPARWGLNGATFEFIWDGLMEKATKFAKVVAGREHHAAWFKTIDHPDANLIKAAPDLLEALELAADLSLYDPASRIQPPLAEKWGRCFSVEFPEGDPEYLADLEHLSKRLRIKAIAKATGKGS